MMIRMVLMMMQNQTKMILIGLMTIRMMLQIEKAHSIDSLIQTKPHYDETDSIDDDTKPNKDDTDGVDDNGNDDLDGENRQH